MAGEVVLIVEDNEKNLKLARDVLQFNGYKTLEAVTAEGGIELARRERPALILMDIQLPGMDGFAAFDQLQQDAATSDIPVLAVTASAMAQDQSRILKAGFHGYLAKPISVKDLVARVARIIGASGAEAGDATVGDT